MVEQENEDVAVGSGDMGERQPTAERVTIEGIENSKGQVCIECARITFEILTLPELGWIHIDTDDDTVGVLPGGAHQFQVTFVEIAHGRNQGRLQTILAPRPGK